MRLLSIRDSNIHPTRLHHARRAASHHVLVAVHISYQARLDRSRLPRYCIQLLSRPITTICIRRLDFIITNRGAAHTDNTQRQTSPTAGRARPWACWVIGLL
jgi:hypothetical protein